MKYNLNEKQIKKLIDTGDSLKEVLDYDQLGMYNEIVNKIRKLAYSKNSIITEDTLCNCSGSDFISTCIISGIKINFEFIKKGV